MTIVRKKLRRRWISKFYVIVGFLTLPYYSTSEAIFYSSDDTRTNVHTILYNTQTIEKTDVGLFSSLTQFSFAPFNLGIFYRHFSDLEKRNFKNFKEQVYIKVFTWDCGALFGGTCFFNCDEKKKYYRQCQRATKDIQKFFKNMSKNLNRYANREKAKARRLNERLKKVNNKRYDWVDQLTLCDNLSEEISELSELLIDLFKQGEDLQSFREIFNTVKNNYADLNFSKQIEVIRDELDNTREDELVHELLDVLEHLHVNEIIPNLNSFIYDFTDSYDDFDNTNVENLIKTLLDSVLHLLSISRTSIIDSIKRIDYDIMEATTAFTDQQWRFERISRVIPKNIRYSIIKTEEKISEYEQIKKVKKPMEVNHRTYNYPSRGVFDFEP